MSDHNVISTQSGTAMDIHSDLDIPFEPKEETKLEEDPLYCGQNTDAAVAHDNGPAMEVQSESFEPKEELKLTEFPPNCSQNTDATGVDDRQTSVGIHSESIQPIEELMLKQEPPDDTDNADYTKTDQLHSERFTIELIKEEPPDCGADENADSNLVLNMPYRLVFTKNGPHDEVCAVPEGWVVEPYLYWPRNLKKNEIESLRSNPKSIPDKNWKKFKCRIKLSDISTFEEALRLEEVYSKFEGTEDEDRYLQEQKQKKKNPAAAVDSLFDLCKGTLDEGTKEPENKTTSDSIKKNIQSSSTDASDNQYTLKKAQDNTTTEELVTISASELYKLINENNSLQQENEALKQEFKNSAEFRNETKRNFSIIQTQLDKILETIQKEKYSKTDDVPINKDEIMLGNVKFPIETKLQLDELEYKLIDQNAMTYLVTKFSEICGTSGLAKLSKVGLTLVKLFIKDELLNQFAWKGIRGSEKMAFIQYVKIRELFHKVARLADKSCSYTDTDLFLKNSAIKHSGQRLKRRISSSESKLNLKKAKIETNEQYKSEEEKEIIDNTINAEIYEDSTEVVNENETNDEYSIITENNRESGTNGKKERSIIVRKTKKY